MPDLDCTIAALHLYPVKSCAGLAQDAVRLEAEGLALDRAWMVVDRDAEMLTQRSHPRLARVRPRPGPDGLRLQAPGQPELLVPPEADAGPTRVRVWDDVVAARELGREADAWISAVLGERAQLVRFAPGARRLADARWTGGVSAPTRFSDGFPLLVCSTASLAELNRRLAAQGQPAVGIERFRPNLVLDGLQAFDEDHIDELRIDADGGEVRLRLVKPCVRCTIPDVDPDTGEPGHEPGRTLAGFRADARMAGGITFGMNAIVLDGAGRTLRAGQRAGAALGFDG